MGESVIRVYEEFSCTTGCGATERFEVTKKKIPLRTLHKYLRRRGWEIAGSRGSWKHYCPGHPELAEEFGRLF